MSNDLIEQRTDHEELAVSRFLDQFKDSVKVKALAESYAAQIQDLEDATFEVILERVLDNAVGVQLTTIGAIVGQPRTTSNDDHYKMAIRARIAINVSESTPEDLILITILLLAIEEQSFKIVEEPPCQARIVVIDPINPTLADPYLMQDLLDGADPAASRLLLDWTEQARTLGFVFKDQAGGTVVGGGFGDAALGATASGDFTSVAE